MSYLIKSVKLFLKLSKKFLCIFFSFQLLNYYNDTITKKGYRIGVGPLHFPTLSQINLLRYSNDRFQYGNAAVRQTVEIESKNLLVSLQVVLYSTTRGKTYRGNNINLKM